MIFFVRIKIMKVDKCNILSLQFDDWSIDSLHHGILSPFYILTALYATEGLGYFLSLFPFVAVVFELAPGSCGMILKLQTHFPDRFPTVAVKI